MKWKKIYFIDHAEERFLIRGIPKEKINEMLSQGVIIDDPKNPIRKICIYKESEDKYYSIVFEEVKQALFSVTGYYSNSIEIKYYNKAEKRWM